MELVTIGVGLIVLIIQICLIVAILQVPGLLKTLIKSNNHVQYSMADVSKLLKNLIVETRLVKTQLHYDLSALSGTGTELAEVEGELTAEDSDRSDV